MTYQGAEFAIGSATAWRYVREAVDLLAARAECVTARRCMSCRLAFAILDGTLVPIDRVADQNELRPPRPAVRLSDRAPGLLSAT